MQSTTDFGEKGPSLWKSVEKYENKELKLWKY